MNHDLPRYNVIIAGGGPAGSTAGYLLSKAGLRVLIIDKSTFPRKKLCGGLITYKTVKLLQRVFGETPESLKEKDIINHESCCYEIFSRKTLIAQRTVKFPFMFVDRKRYDHYFLEKAQNAGAGLIEGDGVISLDVLKSMVTTMSGRKFAADIIIGADGVNSRIRRSFPVDLFGRDDWTGNLAAALEIFPARETIKKRIDHPVLYFGFIDWGYAWIFPNRERLKIGICALKKRNKKKILAAFRNFLSAMDFPDAQEEKISSYVLPYGSFLPSPIFRNIMLLGDAAGLADPLFGEGIFYAQRSAELASQAILEVMKNKRDIGKSQDVSANIYLKLLQKQIYPELVHAEKFRRVTFTYLNKFHYYPMKIMMSILGNKLGETVHGIRSYNWMKKLPEV
ncbi:MAG TPA: geranylgeranyl reductase family protein [Nitrospirae bacterium]|nr:putative oxidoreductase/MT0587 [bacterium BMS3Abin06]HDH11712.1 geranylgeranyl reductase family protein [Nitrospirota bacterium]HDZ03214.1 geranylgeranyl reductase family protein [Nitrospirota bacterium]